MSNLDLALIGLVRAEQEYLTNTAVLVTRLYDDDGNVVGITDLSPHGYDLVGLWRSIRSGGALPSLFWPA